MTKKQGEHDPLEEMRQFRKKIDIESIQRNIMHGFGEVSKSINSMGLEIDKIQRPVSKKEVRIDGTSCTVSLTRDCRVVVQLPTQMAAEMFYNYLDKKYEPWYRRILKRWLKL